MSDYSLVEETADLLFVNDNEKEVEKELAKKVSLDLPETAPGNYIKVKLSSLGKLSAPEEVYVRNYTFEEALELSEITEDNEKEVMIRVLNSMLWGDVDASLLHDSEAIEILLNVYARWWGTSVEGFKYFVDENLTGEEKEAPTNISIAEIPISNIKTKELSEEVKEPFTLSKEGLSVSFILPRMKTSVIAKNFVNKKYAKEENKFSSLKHKIKANKEYSFEEYNEFIDYTKKKAKDYLRAFQAQLIYSVDGKEVASFEEALKVLSKLDLTLWKEYNDTLEKYFVFGVDPKVEFDCSVNHTPITRRFQFRPMVFLPSVESKNDTGYSVSFG